MIRKIQSALIWMAAITLLICACTLGSCSRGAKPRAEAEEEEAIARTEFTERIENFFEYAPLKAGKPSQFRIHLTDLSDGSPVEKAELKLMISANGGGDSRVKMEDRGEWRWRLGGTGNGKSGKVTGIYVAEVNIPKVGDYDIEFHVRNAKLDERMPLTDFKVE